MSNTMPEAVRLFIEATNTGNTDQLGPVMASDAVLRDAPENRIISGAQAINDFLLESKEQYAIVLTVTHTNCTSNKVSLTVEAKGNFAGSPLAFSYCFIMQGSIIHHLTIDLA